jgi:outer membrane receptor protein involved in Fe transport
VKRFILCLLLIPILSRGAFVYGQGDREQTTGIYEGIIRDAVDDTPLPGATVQIQETGQWSVADSLGHFTFLKMPSGTFTLTIRMLGYRRIEEKVNVTPSGVSGMPAEFLLSPLNIEMEGVTVTAREAELGSVSQLEGYAIKHTQPVSLSDVLQLVPGQLAQNPTLGSAAQFTLRQAPSGAASERMNALGTALIMDGAPISNNSNLQTNNNILNASPGSLPPFSSVAGRGLDLRAIPADLIESIEVIRGIPSAKHGDLSSGAVLVNTRLGAYAPKMLVRINPTVRQFSFGAGKKVNNRNVVNTELDLTTALTDPRNDLEQYTRANLQFGWDNQLGKLNLKHRLTLFTTLDQTREAPEDDVTRRKNYNRERGVRINSQGRWKNEEKFLQEMQYVFSISYQHQESFFQEQVTRDIFPVSDAIVDTTKVAEYGKSSYLNQTRIDGKPLNAYLRLEIGKSVSSGLGNHRAIGGFEWRHDSNAGNGRQFDPKNPPRQNYSVGDRPRSFSNIPSLNQLGFYLSDRWSVSFKNRSLLVEWGIRADLMYRPSQPGIVIDEQERSLFFVPAPRINASLLLGKGWHVRAGYGVMAKMPTLSYLYPNPVFFDLVNFNYFANDPEERLVVLTTRKIIPNTIALRPYQSQKREFGFDYRPETGGWNFSLSVFHEQMDDAYQILRQVLPIKNPKFEAEAFPVGKPPILMPEPAAIDTFMAAYDLPQNNLAITNKGFDFSLQTPQVKALRTSLNLTGALLNTRSKQTTPFLDANRAVFNNQFSGKVPIFPSGQGMESMRFNTSLRLIHHIPALKFIVSGLVQTVWQEQNRLIGYEEIPEAYLGRNGKKTQLTDAPLNNAMVDELSRTINPESLRWQQRPPLWLFNIRLTKEWAPQRGFAFYVNNLMNSRPLFTSNVSGFQIARNQPEFFFGAEVYYQF